MLLDFWKLFGPFIGVICGGGLVWGGGALNARSAHKRQLELERLRAIQARRDKRLDQLRDAYRTIFTAASAREPGEVQPTIEAIDQAIGLLAIERDVKTPGAPVAKAAAQLFAVQQVLRAERKAAAAVPPAQLQAIRETNAPLENPPPVDDTSLPSPTAILARHLVASGAVIAAAQDAAHAHLAAIDPSVD